MPGEYEPVPQPDTPRRSAIRTLIVVGVAFLGGLIAMGWLLVNFGASLGIMAAPESAEPSRESSAAVAALEQQLDEAEPGTPGAPVGEASEPSNITADRTGLARRVTVLENRIDSRASSSVINADRAEGLLVAFAARRALDRGVGLGYIEGLLRDRFGRSAPEAVARIIAASQQPVTLDGLQSRLNELSPALAGRGADESFWVSARREFSEIFVLRQEGTPSPAPRDRLQRAKDKLAVGQVDTALAEILRLPGREEAAPWISDARRYIAARNALDRVETIALIEPRIAERRQRRNESARTPPQNAAEAQGGSQN